VFVDKCDGPIGNSHVLSGTADQSCAWDGWEGRETLLRVARAPVEIDAFPASSVKQINSRSLPLVSEAF
jgi:hypothetical protein